MRGIRRITSSPGCRWMSIGVPAITTRCARCTIPKRCSGLAVRRASTPSILPWTDGNSGEGKRARWRAGMDTLRPPETRTEAAEAQSLAPEAAPVLRMPAPKGPPPASSRIPELIVAVVAGVIATLSIWYLLRGEPLLVQGEVDATRLDIAARVDGRVAAVPVARGQNVEAGALLVKIDNPETIAKHQQALAAKVVAEAQVSNIRAGTRAETIAARKAALERAQANVVLAQKTYDRVSQLTEHGNAPQARLDQVTDTLHQSQRAEDQARSDYRKAINGYTREEREIAIANVGKAEADIKAVQSIIDQLEIYGPVASQVYKRHLQPGEYVAPGVPLVTLIDLVDVWVHFDLREDLIKGLKVGDRFSVRIPALADRSVTVEVRLIATKGEYASWRATRASGDFDLRTFSIRAYPVQPVPELRPGMSAYLDWRSRP